MLVCPRCGETEELSGDRGEAGIVVSCRRCGERWTRDLEATCSRCGRGGMFTAIAAIIEKGRGTQLSVVGTRQVRLCEVCDASTIRTYLDSRPNPLMPDELPNTEES